MLNCSVILDATAQCFGDNEAVVSRGERWTYTRLNRAACQLANGLRKAGIKKGDRLILACPNRTEFIIAFFGILKAGAVVVPISVLSKRRELAFLIGDTQAKGIICFEGTEDLEIGKETAAAVRETDTCRRLWMIPDQPGGSISFDSASPLNNLMQGMPDEIDSVWTEPGETAVILYTSGTTGKPKGAELTHQNIYSTAATAGRLSNVTASDTSVVALPLFHCYAQTVQMNAGFLCASRLVLLERFHPDSVLQSLQDENGTLFCGVPTMYWSLLHHERASDYDLARIAKNLRIGCSGGAPIPVEVIKGIEEKYQFQILEGYGLSETSAMATFNQPHRPRKVGSVGLPVWGVQVRVVDPDMKDVPPGDRGEVVIRGHCVMKGYFNRPEATEEAFRGGWFHTGDVGKKDEDGYLYIVDRTKDMIIRGGFNVYPREIEEVLSAHPDISLSAVVGKPDPKYGEEVMAFVILKDGSALRTEDIVAWSKKEMASYKYPRIVRVVDELPMGATGKVLKTELRNRLKEGGI